MTDNYILGKSISNPPTIEATNNALSHVNMLSTTVVLDGGGPTTRWTCCKCEVELIDKASGTKPPVYAFKVYSTCSTIHLLMVSLRFLSRTGTIPDRIDNLEAWSVDLLTDRQSFCSITLSQNSVRFIKMLERSINGNHLRSINEMTGRRLLRGLSLRHWFLHSLIDFHFGQFSYKT